MASATTDQASPSDSPSSSTSGFKAFFSRKDSTASKQDVTFVQQDPSTKKASGKLSRLLKRTSQTSPTTPQQDENKSEAQKRRQQVYQAQKRHRNRKAEYVKSLEEEVAKLQHLDSVINSEKNAINFQNQQMRELLASHSLDFQMEATTLEPAETRNMDLGSAELNIRFDPEIGHERTFVDWSEMDWTTTSGSETARASISQSATPPVPGKSSASPAPPRKGSAKGDSWAAVDFILALEWPCQGHIHHHGINPEAVIPVACQESGGHGHALTATATVYESALPLEKGEDGGQTLQVPGKKGEGQEKWLLPHAEIDKLVQMSENLPMDDISITPAQAYSAIKDAVPSDAQLRPCLDAMRVPLSSLVQCTGFGAFMPADGFWKELDKMIEQFGDVEEATEKESS